jgi:hypothetical protein
LYCKVNANTKQSASGKIEAVGHDEFEPTPYVMPAKAGIQYAAA